MFWEARELWVFGGMFWGELLGGCQRVRGERGVVLRIWGKGLVRLDCQSGRDRGPSQVCFVHVAIKRVSESRGGAGFCEQLRSFLALKV